MNVFINIRTINFTITITLDEIKPSDTIEKIKKKIEALKGIPVENQILTFEGKQLKNADNLDFYNIKEFSDLNLFIFETSNLNLSMKIDIEMPNGNIITLEVKQMETIGNIKEKIKKFEWIPFDQQILIYKEKLLDESTILYYYKIINGSLLHLLPFGSSIVNFLIELYVKTLSGKTILLEIRPIDTILNAKKKTRRFRRISSRSTEINFCWKTVRR